MTKKTKATPGTARVKLVVMVPADLAARIEAVRAGAEARAGMPISTADVVRTVIRDGVEVRERPGLAKRERASVAAEVTV